ncbi:hypothetical protein OG349_06575 [Streptomyces sp. NBC_01317]|nr:hypothetical protein OG349_06575 [Streptomyces sp. NBC_01317]
MQHMGDLEALLPILAGYGLGRAHQWSRVWRTTPLRRRLERAVDAFRKAK